MPARFRTIVLGVPEIAGAYMPGLQALSSLDAERLSCSDPRKLAGSVNLDDCLKAAYPNEPRWDYAIGQTRRADDQVHWVEVHPCRASEVQVIVRKARWLKRWMLSHAPDLRRMTHTYTWVPAGRVSLPSTSPQYRLAVLEGIRISPRICRLF